MDRERQQMQAAPATVRQDKRLANEWFDLSVQAQQAALTKKSCSVNKSLLKAIQREPQAPTSPAFSLCVAKNLVREGNLEDAISAFDEVLTIEQQAEKIHPNLDFSIAALHGQAVAAIKNNQSDLAFSQWRVLCQKEGVSKGYALAAAQYAEAQAMRSDAEWFYQLIAAPEPQMGRCSNEQMACRALLRMKNKQEKSFASPELLAEKLLAALETSNAQQLNALLSTTHFVMGLPGGHFYFEEDRVRAQVLEDLVSTIGTISRSMTGIGEKRYLFMNGWNTSLLKGDVCFLFSQSSRGWAWTGVLSSVIGAHDVVEPITSAQDPAAARLAFAIKAPWPAGRHFMAGGLIPFAVKVAQIAAAAAAGGPFGPIAAGVLTAAFAANRCGFGPRGFYYRDPFSHNGVDRFALDFTSYRRFVPFDPESSGTAVLAAAPGLIVGVRDDISSGSSSAANTVEIMHPDPVTGADRYLSRYLHLAGPDRVPVNLGMAAITGMRLGVMNDTGRSALSHLHFSIHDQNQPVGGTSPGPNSVIRGQSIKPTPMDGERLEDFDDGQCVLSSNRERRPAPQDDAQFISQSVPNNGEPGVPIAVSITMRNTGPTTWRPGYRLDSLGTGWTTTSVAVNRTVEQNDTITFNFNVTAISRGDFRFQWQMARQFSGRFGQSSTKRTVRIGSVTDPQTCNQLEDALEAANISLRDWQDMLEEFPGNKEGIIKQINRVKGEIAGIRAQMISLGCG